ncbi:HD domain-containing protein [Salinimicrobium sediminilitoris]|uniref:HD domain-containing protein n=1 Tax=Salinimicrobium sediminilitoris TaxID=2876715 RepID=UPI001E3167D5|nr:HD domain-containing protein [Salinimicrobium sediminilitoris]MCC8361199.1 HD domain-containing protein [Salinimicrobium sediminilitoris]
MFEKIYKKVMSNLESNLPSWLYYHSPAHTKYVLEKSIFLAQQEGVTGRELFLIMVAALYHDLGFVKGRDNHEKRSCEMASEELPELGITSEEVQKICNMILATQIPQKPKTLSEKILADADLEYLGTNSFYEISEKLYQELLHDKPELNRQQWNEIQVNFLSGHTYHTRYCKVHCEPIKAAHLAELQAQIES